MEGFKAYHAMTRDPLGRFCGHFEWSIHIRKGFPSKIMNE
jgi:hypothetical protein